MSSFRARALHRAVDVDLGAEEAGYAAPAELGDRCGSIGVAGLGPALDSATLPALASTETTMRWPWASSIASRNSGSRRAAVPITARSAPASRIARTDCGSRRPPPTWIGQATPAAIRSIASRLRGSPALAPSRSTTWRNSAPSPAQRLAASTRVGVVGGLALVVALQQPHGLAAADVDGGIEDHAGTAEQTPAKLASRRRPAPLDFSGWNWTPKTLSRCAAQAKRAP